MTWPSAAAHDRQDGAGDVQRAEEVGLHLCPELVGADVLEVAGVEVAGVVDEHVDAAEPLDGGLRRPLGCGRVGDVEGDGEQVLVRADGLLTRSASRPVATTECPAASAAWAMSMPRPRPAPVMNQTLLLMMDAFSEVPAGVSGG